MGTVITASSYKLRSMLNVGRRVPEEVLRFASEVSLSWRPAPLFVMDVCEVENGLRVVEYNCLNASGFYACDVRAVVEAATSYVRGLGPS